MIWRALIPVKPSGAGRPRVFLQGGKSIATTPQKSRDKADELKVHLMCNRPHMFKGPVKVRLLCTFMRPKSAPKSREYPTVKPDIDNIGKLVLDCANRILWLDDTQVVELHVFKVYGSPESVIIEVEDM